MPATKAKPTVSETLPRESKLPRVFALLFFGGLFLYLGLIVRPTLIYHAFARFIPYPEFSLQMSFLRACLSRPGGLLECAEGFLSQWFYYSWAGAAILTALAWAAYACTASLLDSSRSVSENPSLMPESEQFGRLAKRPKQAMLVLSSIQADAARRSKGRSKLDWVLRQAPRKVRLRILPYVPALAMIAAYSGYYHCLPTILILLCALLATLLYRHASSLHRTGRTLAFFTLACALYYLSGPGCLLLMMLAVVHETFPGRYRLSLILYPLLCAIGVGLVGVVIFGLDEIQAVQLLWPFGNRDVTHLDWPSAQIVILVACLCVPLGLLLDRFERKSVKASRQARRRRKARRAQMTGILGSSRFWLAATSP